MTLQRIHLIRIVLVSLVILALAGANVYTYLQLRKHADVINRQGTLIKVMLETPEINAVVARKVQQLQAEAAANNQE